MPRRGTEEDLVELHALQEQVRVVLPGEADAAVDQQRRARTRREHAGPTYDDVIAAVVAHAAGSPSSASAAARVAARLASTAIAMSAQWCFTAWNEPIGLPNCVRSFAYSAARSSACSATPAASHAAATTPMASTRVEQRLRGARPARTACGRRRRRRRRTSTVNSRRVSSTVAARSTRTPGASRRPRPRRRCRRSSRAATTSTSATSASSTKPDGSAQAHRPAVRPPAGRERA